MKGRIDECGYATESMRLMITEIEHGKQFGPRN